VDRWQSDIFGPVTLAKPHARTTPIFLDEFDPGSFEGLFHNNKSGAPRCRLSGFYLPNSDDSNARFAG
jgi:hypothetical protein